MSKYWGVKLSWLNENMSIVNWVQKSSTSTLCVVAERRGSHHLIWWKNHTKTDHYDFFIFLYFLTIKGSWKKFLCKISASHHAFYDHLALASSAFSLMIKRRKKSMQKNMHFLATYPQKFIWFFGSSYGAICFENCSKLNFIFMI